MMTFQTHATVTTDKASRYLQALCGHFDRKVNAEWSETKGDVDFGFGHCRMQADEKALLIYVRAETEEDFARVKDVVSDHLERFAVKDNLKVFWHRPAQATSATSSGEVL